MRYRNHRYEGDGGTGSGDDDDGGGHDGDVVIMMMKNKQKKKMLMMMVNDGHRSEADRDIAGVRLHRMGHKEADKASPGPCSPDMNCRNPRRNMMLLII